MITFICPTCKKQLTVKDEFAGKTGSCPHCKSKMIVPAAGVAPGGTKLKSAVAVTTAPPPAHPEVSSTASSAAPQEMTQPGVKVPAHVPGQDEDLSILGPPQGKDEIGRLGPYKILRKLGAGGMGAVLLGFDPELERKVAIKIMKPSMAQSEPAKLRFLREAKTSASVKHDHVVTIHQVGKFRGVPFLAMEYLEGEPLDERIKRENKLPISEVLRIGRETAEGLSAAHAKGLTHRDLKPANLWLEAPKGRIKLLDFGLAKSAAEDTHLTASGAIVGTPAFMSPEQASSQPIDHRCDLFSLGVVLYRLCTGELPFKGTNAMAIILSLSQDHPKPPFKINPEVPDELSALIMKLLEKKKEKRLQSAQAVVESIKSIENTQTILLASGAPVKKPRRGVAGVFLWLIWIVLKGMGQGVAAVWSWSGVSIRRRLALAGTLALAAGALYLYIPTLMVDPATTKQDAVTKTEKKTGKETTEVVKEDRLKWDAKFEAIGNARPKLSVDEGWIKSVSKMNGEEQIGLFIVKLKELNPRFDPRSVKHKIENGVVTELEFPTIAITDISPVRALLGLKKFVCRTNKPTSRGAAESSHSGTPLFGRGLLFDLSPLNALQLTLLDCSHTTVKELSPVSNMPIEELYCDIPNWFNTDILRSIKTLKQINGKPASEFLKDIDARFTSYEDWRKRVSGFAPEVQVAAITVKLKELNPLLKEDPDFQVKHKIENGVISELEFSSCLIHDISPVRALPGLKKLVCGYSGDNIRSDVFDLSPLKGMSLTSLDCARTLVSDLSPLKGMPLTSLNCRGTLVSDLSPLKGKPLEKLMFHETLVTDLSPLKGLPLKELSYDMKPERDTEILRSIKTLEKINGQPVANVLPVKK